MLSPCLWDNGQVIFQPEWFPFSKGVEAESGNADWFQIPVFLLFYDVLFRPSFIPSADAWKRAWAWNGWGLCGKYAHAYCEEDFPCKYRPFRIKPVLPLHRQRDELDGRILYSICSLHSIESLIHLWIIQISQKSSITFGRIQRNDYLCTRWWVINGCRLSVRCSLMQFIAECGIEYGCQFVTRIFLKSPDCLYLKKSWEFVQSYEKSRAKQKNLFFFLPRRSNFAIFFAKLRKSEWKTKWKDNFLFW